MHRICLITSLPSTSRDVVCRRTTVRTGDITVPALKRKQWQPTASDTRHRLHRRSTAKDASCPQVSGIPAAPVEEGSSDRQKSLGRPRNTLEKPWLWPSAFPPWQWGSSLTWRSACLFFMGSILFTLSCSTGLFQIMARHSLRNRLCVAYPYAAGSLIYTWGAYSTMVASADALRQLELQGGGAHMQGPAPPRKPVKQSPALLTRSGGRRKQHYFTLQMCSWSAHDWASLDLAGAVIVWAGTLLYNSSCITPAILATLTAPLPASTMAAVLQWAVKVPNIIAGCFFVTGSYSAWVAASRSPSLLHICRHRLPTGSFWAFLLYLLGSVGFLTGAVLTEPMFVLSASVLIDEWFGMFVGYFLGSLCFLSGSFLGMTIVT